MTIGTGTILAIVLGVLVLYVGLGTVPYWIKSVGIKIEPEHGTFGDSFGFANAFFSAVAFICVAVTLRMQRQELELQRQEMRLARKEQRLSRQAQEKSEQRLLLAAYLNALDTSREIAKWRLQYKISDNPSYAEAKAAADQARTADVIDYILEKAEDNTNHLKLFYEGLEKAKRRHAQCMKVLSIAFDVRLCKNNYCRIAIDDNNISTIVGAIWEVFRRLGDLASDKDAGVTFRAADLMQAVDKISSKILTKRLLDEDDLTALEIDIKKHAIQDALKLWL